ncbi:MAG: tryptophan--tRNA ligase [Deltaproteobacteria bacterium]|nr:tryptophan--tRNA ligase [Deltaproteobacteria bacterium]
MSKRVFSGIQPTGTLHLGNYLGAIRQWVAHQDERDNIFCVVDLHALTVPEAVDPGALRAKSREVAALYIASGIDPERSAIFIQSHVRQHSELTWVLNCTTPLGWLERMTQFKTKAEGRESVGMGLLDYPVLMAADILLYDTEIVPVGADQKQHIELARDMAVRFNNLFGETFVVPEVTIPPAGARVMGFDDATQKMSKSAKGSGHAVGLLDGAKQIKKTIMGAKTDLDLEFRPEHASAGVLNLMGVLQAFTGEPLDAMAARFEGTGYGYLKGEVYEATMEALTPIQARHKELMGDPAELDLVLARAAERVGAIAEGTMARVRKAVGIG